MRVALAGRMMTRRVMGKASFAHLQDDSGQIQLYLQRDSLPQGFYNEQFKKWDIGDIIGVQGALFRTRTGELSVKVDQVCLLVKALRPLPEKWHGLQDQEVRYRQRYLDLIMNEKSRSLFRLRSRLIAGLRSFLLERDYLEVETPMMHPLPGGAAARPFKTHHNALDMTLYLRIAPELYLKRLVVGGLERVFEVNRSFRNEGVSTRHNPEFTMVEFYQAYASYHDMMDLTEVMLGFLAQTLLGTTTLSYQGAELEFSAPFTRITMRDAVLAHNPGLTAETATHQDALRARLEAVGAHWEPSWGTGKLLTELFEKTVEESLHQPTFVTAFPTEVSPLARCSDDNPEVTDRFELFIAGREIANGFSELNDADDQAARFHAQTAERAAGDDEAMYYDADYVRALEYGMPPTAGQGIGIDRLVMLFVDAPSIRDVLLFPHMRPEQHFEA
ncbi:MAG: lysine--tRNA ligase [Gammaproteobacteria bacterium]|nr:lysine--tRNA ligase [Gammaproteobacteria bacterium]